jgi:hypothetical protein
VDRHDRLRQPQYEVESEKRKVAEEELKWARQAIADEEAAKRGRLR